MRLLRSTVFCALFIAASGIATARVFDWEKQTPLQAPWGATELTSMELASYAPFTQFAGAAYCELKRVKAWDCAPCRQVPGFQPMETGGDGNGVQQFFIGFWPEHNAVVLSHEGTDPKELLSDLTDMGVLKRRLNPELFPGIPSEVEAHHGFANEHEKTGPTTLARVHLIIRETKATNLFIVGHSLGGALSELDALYFTLNLPSFKIPWNVSIKTVTYGTPRVGNGAWAEFFDHKVANFTRINNRKDPVVIVPPIEFGFQHPRGEIHILPNGKAYACDGDENATDRECTLLSNPHIDWPYWTDHLGPYGGIMIGTDRCL